MTQKIRCHSPLLITFLLLLYIYFNKLTDSTNYIIIKMNSKKKHIKNKKIYIYPINYYSTYFYINFWTYTISSSTFICNIRFIQLTTL